MISAPASRSRSRRDVGFHRGERDHPSASSITVYHPPAPPIVTVFRSPDGSLVHAWCGQPLEFQGRRAGLELDFFCHRCVEHVPLPECVMSRIPLGSATGQGARAAH